MHATTARRLHDSSMEIITQTSGCSNSTTAYSHATPAPRFRIQSHFGIFCSLRILTRRAYPPVLAYGCILASFSILTRRYSRVRSHFHSLFTPSAFTHAAVLAYDRIFAGFCSLCILTPRCSRIWSHFRCFCSHCILTRRPRPAFSQTIEFSLLLLSCSILTRRCPCIRLHFCCICSLLAFSYAAVHAFGRILAAFVFIQHSRTPLFSNTAMR